MMPSSIAAVAKIRRELALLRAAMASPEPSAIEEALPGILPGIHAAIHTLQSAAPESSVRTELLALRSELRRTSLMIQNSGVMAANTGYTPAGAPAASDNLAARFVEQG
jgi:hypothetical protein